MAWGGLRREVERGKVRGSGLGFGFGQPAYFWRFGKPLGGYVEPGAEGIQDVDLGNKTEDVGRSLL